MPNMKKKIRQSNRHKGKNVKTEAQNEVNAVTSQRMPRIANHHQKLEEAKMDSFLEPLERAWPCARLDFELLCSKTVRD